MGGATACGYSRSPVRTGARLGAGPDVDETNLRLLGVVGLQDPIRSGRCRMP